jgi:butyryl-CoA dehydrogenase
MTGKNSHQAPVRIIEHVDVRRMLLAQKSYAEGALALELYCARLVDDTHTAPDAATLDEAKMLLEVLTPIAKSWPSEWCLEANSLAIQVHGGYGYTRDFPVEQFWRDNRLNMIHEGTHGVQALDLLGRKVLMDNGRGLRLWVARVQATAMQAQHWVALLRTSRPADLNGLEQAAPALISALTRVQHATHAAWADEATPTEALANAVPYMQAFGHVVLAWLWLDVACAIWSSIQAQSTNPLPCVALSDEAMGRLCAAAYFFDYELPKIGAWLNVVEQRNLLCATMPEAAF